MSHRLLVVPTAHGVGLTSVCLGIVRAFDQLGVPLAFFKPVCHHAGGPDRSTALVRRMTSLTPPEPIPKLEAERLLGEGRQAELLERIVEALEQTAQNASVVVIEGLVPQPDVVYATSLNVAVARALDAEVVLVSAAGSAEPAKIADNIDIAARAYGEVQDRRSCIINRASSDPEAVAALRRALEAERLHPLGIVPYEPLLSSPRVIELQRELGAEVINQGDWHNRRVENIHLCASSVAVAAKVFARGTLIITPGDRVDIVVAAALASLEGVKLAGLLLTGEERPPEHMMALCRRAFDDGLPVLAVRDLSYTTAHRVHTLRREVPPDDVDRAELVMKTFAEHLDEDWLRKLASAARQTRMTTPAFRHQLVQRARAANKIIVLPEGAEPRTVRAAAICAERGIARCVLLGEPAQIREVARLEGVHLGEGVRIVDARPEIPRFVAPMVARRRHKGLSEAMAADQLEDTVVLGTMMLAEGEVDGLVSGAIHTTANTIRPALQLIKTAPGVRIVSSVFFMCLPDEVLVYGDCAVNPDPDAEELAEIAIQSADSAAAFGIEPRVAMISYSTGTSGAGSEVDKVARATALARERRPDLCIDGPLQYDAAAIAEVARQKAPQSPVAGRATVFVFPDLNTGNTTYKAVQRSAGVVSMGPMLQGLAKPVNDLSRGALVEDIVFTIALTAIQAAQRPTRRG